MQRRRTVLQGMATAGLMWTAGCRELGVDSVDTTRSGTDSSGSGTDDVLSRDRAEKIESAASERVKIYERFSIVFSSEERFEEMYGRTLPDWTDFLPSPAAFDAAKEAHTVVKNEKDLKILRAVRAGSLSELGATIDESEDNAVVDLNSNLAKRAGEVSDAAKAYADEPTEARRRTLVDRLKAERELTTNLGELKEWTDIAPVAYNSERVQSSLKAARYLRRMARANVESIESFRTELDQHIGWTSPGDGMATTDEPTESGLAPRWSRTYGTGNIYGVARRSDGSYLVTGGGRDDAGATGNFPAPVVALNAKGSQQWNRTYGTNGAAIFDVVGLGDDTDACIGSIRNPTSERYDAWLFTIDTAGREQWSRTYGEADSRDQFFDAVPTGDAGVLAGGRTGSERTAWALELDGSGSESWRWTDDADGLSYVATVLSVGSEGYLLGGNLYEDGELSGFLLRIDGNGQPRWRQSFTGNGIFDSISLADGTIFVAGADGRSDESSGWAASLDVEGNTRWERTYGKQSGAFLTASQASSGTIYLGGATVANANTAWVLKVGETGEDPTSWQHSANGQSVIRASTPTSSDSVLMTGSAWSEDDPVRFLAAELA